MLGVAIAGCSAKIRVKPDSFYDEHLQSYTTVLKEGITRAEVEGYLQTRKVATQRMCCVGENRRAWVILVKIGSEQRPWYCSEHNVYVAFEFEPVTPPTPPEYSNLPSDVLKRVSLFRWLEGCV